MRPEDLRLRDDGTLRATVRVVEPLGSETYVHLETSDGARVVVRASADVGVAVDQRLGLQIPVEKAHLFRDPDGKRIGP